MKKPIHILHLEDNPVDQAWVQCELELHFPCKLDWAQTLDDFQKALARPEIDLILSDYSLPDFTGIEALQLSQARRPEIPFIFLSGTLGEEQAVECLKLGAADYVLKERPLRLASLIEKAVSKSDEGASLLELREEIRQKKDLLSIIVDHVHDLVAVVDINGRYLFNNAAHSRLFGNAKAMQGTDLFGEIHPDDRERVRGLFKKTAGAGEEMETRLRLVLSDGRTRLFASTFTALRDERGRIGEVILVSHELPR